MSVTVTESESIELENILQQTFMECNVSVPILTTHTISHVENEVPISRIVEYVQDQLPICPTEHLLELRKCLVAVSTTDSVNWLQFKEASSRWIAKVQQVQSQDDNNNVDDKLYNIMSDTTSNSLKTDMDRNITEIELRMRVRKFDEENIILREELMRTEEIITNLERQRTHLETQLDRYVEKCQQLEKENDEQKDKLNEIIKKEQTCASTLQKSMKEYEKLLKQLEAAEIEIQAIPFLKNKMEKMNKEKTDYVRQIVKLQEEFEEKENDYDRLKAMLTELEDANTSMKQTYEHTIRNLREKNGQLIEQNMELQSWSTLNEYTNGERLSLSPIPNTDGCCTHSTPYKSEKVQLQNSLYTELKASGFTAECSRSDSWRQELEEELNQYDDVICTVLKQLERIIQAFATMWSSTEVPEFNSQDMDPRTCNIEALKHKTTFLLNMATKEISKSITKDSSTQLCAEPDMIQRLNQFNITSFQDLLTCIHPKVETDLQSIISQYVNDNKDDLFLKVIRANTDIRSDGNILDPIVEELNRIIQDTTDSPVMSKNHPANGNSRYRSIHTLHGCHNSGPNSPDVLFAQGDSLAQENCDKETTEFRVELRKDSNKENLIHLEKNQISEMPIVSNVLQVDSLPEALPALDETNVSDLQASEINNPGITMSPRRKISVYCRSFDVAAVQNQRKDQELNLEIRRSLSSPSGGVHKKEEIGETMEDYACGLKNALGHSFIGTYRNVKNDSDSSDNSSPQKQFRDNLPDEDIPIQQPMLRKVYLAPTRLNFSQIRENTIFQNLSKSQESLSKDEEVNKKINETNKPLDANSSESDRPSFCQSPVVDMEYNKSDNASVHSPSFTVDHGERTNTAAVIESKLNSINEDISQDYLAPIHPISHNQSNSMKIKNSENPHSWTNVQKVGGQPRIESVGTEMSNRENSSVRSDSDYESAKSNDQCIDEKIAASPVSPAIINPVSTKVICETIVSQQNDKKVYDKDLDTKQERRQRLCIVRRSLSEGENNSRIECCCRQKEKFQTASLIQKGGQPLVFPSLTDIRLQESGIANLSDIEIGRRESLSELELQKRYTSFSLCLCTDRVTLPQRMTLALRQRDQSERNLSYEIQKMQQDIQELAPLCTDRESVERVERVKHQLDMIAQCAHRVSSVAETLGATHQEHRVSRAILLADRYLQVLQSRCEKLAANVAEIKRILTENNIVIEEHSGELSDDLPRIRYRSGTPANNRIMMARRRASIATISRPMGSTQDVIKDTMRQRNSVSGRVTSRRPSLSYESPKWETEELDRTDFRVSTSSINSISELRDIFEQAESRRNSKEENNNILRLSQSNSQGLINCAIVDNDCWTNLKPESSPVFPLNEDTDQDCRSCERLARTCRIRNIAMSWRMILWGILIFFFGFYVNRVISMINTCNGPLNRWSIEDILNRYVQIRNTAPHPM